MANATTYTKRTLADLGVGGDSQVSVVQEAMATSKASLSAVIAACDRTATKVSAPTDLDRMSPVNLQTQLIAAAIRDYVGQVEIQRNLNQIMATKQQKADVMDELLERAGKKSAASVAHTLPQQTQADPKQKQIDLVAAKLNHVNTQLAAVNKQLQAAQTKFGTAIKAHAAVQNVLQQRSTATTNTGTAPTFALTTADLGAYLRRLTSQPHRASKNELVLKALAQSNNSVSPTHVKAMQKDFDLMWTRLQDVEPDTNLVDVMDTMTELTTTKTGLIEQYQDYSTQLMTLTGGAIRPTPESGAGKSNLFDDAKLASIKYGDTPSITPTR